MTWRFRIIFLLFILLFVFVELRLFWWQVVQASTLSALGESQYGRFIKLTPKRGEIQTSDDFSIAANKISYLVFANPKEVKSISLAASSLASTLEVEQASISSLLTLNRYWVALKRGVDETKKEEVKKLNLPGVGFEEQSIRFYPEASIAAKLLGFVGKDDNGDDKGYFGLEGYYDRLLRGKTGTAIQVHDAQNRPILAKMNEKTAQTDGATLHLHVDRAVQFLAESELKKAVEKYGAQGGMVGIMDPKTGAILAMAGFPSFDVRSYAEYTYDLYKNPFISDTYEPGSTFKPIVMASAIDAGKVLPDTPCSVCGAPVAIGGYEIRTWNNEYKKDITMTDTIIHSDNTGMVFAAQALKLDPLLAYFEKFGIGELTNIDLQGETAGVMRPRDNWYPIDLATASFGQGISITPIELLSAFSAIANNGRRMEPHVVSRIETADGKTVMIPPKELSHPISEKTAKIVTEILVKAVNEGEAKWAKPKGYRIAGKTGTAQIPIAGHYDPTKTIASFIGYAPADNPKFIMLVVFTRPTSSIYGSETAAPTFFSIAKHLLAYYGISPTESGD